MVFLPEDILKIGLAILIGGIIGLEREYRDKAAGFRTIIFICLGSTMITMVSIKLGGPEDPVRIAANIVVGIGFLGAGVILRGRERIMGLTTAATIWISAGLGMAIGGGEYILAGIVLVGVLIVLLIFPRITKGVDRLRDHRVYEIVIPVDEEIIAQVNGLFIDCGMQVKLESQAKTGEQLTRRYEVFGRPTRHHELEEKLLSNPSVISFNY